MWERYLKMEVQYTYASSMDTAYVRESPLAKRPYKLLWQT